MLRRLLVFAVLVATTLGAAGCGAVRLETDEPRAATPDAAEQQRQQLAVEAQRLVVGAEHAASLTGTDAAAVQVLHAVADDARTQLDLLGGVWRPGGRHAREITRLGDATLVLAMLTESGQQVRELAVEADGEGVALLAGIAISRLLRADQLAIALGGEPAAVEAALPSALAPDSATELIRAHDALGQAWEVLAARANGDERAGAAAEAAKWRSSAQTLAALAGVADTPDDPRLVSYALGDDVSATVAHLMDDLARCWLAQITTTSGDDRDRVIDQVLAAARDVGLDQPGAEVAAVPGLAADQ